MIRAGLLALALGIAACSSSSAGERLDRAREVTRTGTPREAAEAWRSVLAVVEHERGSGARKVRVEALAALGDLAYLRLDDPRGAAVAYRRLIAESPSSEPAWEARAKLADIAEQQLHDEAEAIAQRKALAGSGRPGAEGFAYAAARGYFKQGDMEQCRRDCRELVQRWPRGEWADDALLLIGAAYQFEGKHAEAVAAFAEVSRRFPGTEAASRAQFQTARSLSSLGRHEEALSGLLQVLPTHPDPKEVQAEIAREREAIALVRNATPEWGGGEHEAHGE